MKWFCRHWYEAGLIPALASLIFLIVGWSNLQVLQRVSLINFIGILLHQFEEYGFLGGVPVFMNKYMCSGTDRYPLNQFSAMLTNVLIAYTCYLLPVFFPDVIWLGLAPILFGCVFQVMLHLVVFLIKFHHFYNSGLAAVLCIHVPCGIFYIYQTASQGLLTGSQWLFTVIYLVSMILFTISCGQIFFSKKDSKYPFDKKEIEAGEKFAKRLGVTNKK